MSSSVVNNVNVNATGYRLPKKSSWVTFWLDMFFGFLGVHRFYLGHIGMGFLYLFTFGFFMIGAIVDLFLAWKITRNVNEQRGYGRVD
jgi:TM2 domain-containing membrane protein YozV